MPEVTRIKWVSGRLQMVGQRSFVSRLQQGFFQSSFDFQEEATLVGFLLPLTARHQITRLRLAKERETEEPHMTVLSQR